MEQHTTKHAFALYWPNLVQVRSGADILVNEKDLQHRIVNVLRLNVGEQIIFFDQMVNASAKILFISKKEMRVHIAQPTKNKILTPHITFLLPLLKRTALEEVVYGLAEVGVNKIQLVETKKVHRAAFTQKECARLEQIIISAAEQSKHFAFPELVAPIDLDEALRNTDIQKSQKIFFDCAGAPSATLVRMLQDRAVSEIVLLIGPEGDLTLEEKKQVVDTGFQSFALTPTILRAQQAGVVSAALVRALAI